MCVCMRYLVVGWSFMVIGCSRLMASDAVDQAAVLPGTQSWNGLDDIASRLVDGVDTFLFREIDLSVERRAQFWHRDLSSAAAYSASMEPNRQRLAHILGVRDARVAFEGLTLRGHDVSRATGGADRPLQDLCGELARRGTDSRRRSAAGAERNDRASRT